MSVCKTARTQDTVDDCGNPIVPAPLPLTSSEQNRGQSPLNRAFADKFLMVFDIPKFLHTQTQRSNRDCDQVSMDQMQFNIFGTVVPTVALTSISTPFQGHTPKLASHARTLEPMLVNYFIDNTFANYWILWSWAEFIIGAQNSLAGTLAGSQDRVVNRSNITLVDYSTNISVIGLDAYNKPKIEWIYKGCFPTSIGGVQFNYQTPNELTSSFSFEYSFLDCVLH